MTQYAWIQDRNTGKIIKWLPWQYLVDLLEIFTLFNDIILFKARQLGWSWLVAGYADHKVMFNEAAKGLFLSQGEKEAWDLLDKAKFIEQHFPDSLRLRLKHPDSKEVMDFYANDGVIHTLPSTDKAGRSTDATLVVRDELARHPYGKENFAAIGPTIDAGGAQSIDLSTIMKEDWTNHFTERVLRARSGATRKDLRSGLVVFHGGESGAVLVFGGWRLRPARDENKTLDEWFELKIKPKYSAFQIEAEYPETIEEALKHSKVRAFFDVQALEDMLLYVMPPLQSGLDINTRNGMVKIFRLPVVGEKYCIFADPSDGRDDPHAIIVIHPRTGEEMANSHGKVTADECAKIYDELVRFYNNAYNSYEVNATAGGKFAETIERLDTPNRHAFRKGLPVQSKPGQTGWWTGGPTKRDMRDGLEEAVRKRLIIPHDREAIEEFRGYIQPEGDEPQPSGGLHDDFIMAWGGVWQIKKYMPVTEAKIISFEYQQRW